LFFVPAIYLLVAKDRTGEAAEDAAAAEADARADTAAPLALGQARVEG
jgi:hypothetical protein